MTLAKIVFASMTGNTEEIADIVADKLRELDVEVEVDECTTVDAEDFLEADIAIVATYTYGDGELPDEMMDFYEDLSSLNSARLSMTLMLPLLLQERRRGQKVLR